MILYLLWVSLVVAGLLGWGELASRALRISPTGRSSAIFLVLGIAVEGFIAALFATARAGSPRVWVSIQIIGATAFGFYNFLKMKSALNSASRVEWSRWVVSSIAVSVVTLVSSAQAGFRPWNPCDDDPAYLYLARRFWMMGDLNEPFHNRRLTSPGLFSFLQAVMMGPFHEGTLNFADELLGSLLLLFVFWRRRSTGKVYWTGVGLVGMIILSHQYFGAANSSPTFFVFALSVAILPALTEDPCSPRDLGTAGIVFGAGAALLVLVRPNLLAVGFIILLPLVLCFRRYRSRNFIIPLCFAWGITLLPWMVLGVRDVGSPLFPIFKGNLSRIFPFFGYTEQVAVLPHVLSTIRELGNSHWVIAIIVLAVTLLATAEAGGGDISRFKKIFLFSVILSILLVMFYVLVAVTTRRTAPVTWFPRFWAPTLAIPTVLVVLAIRDRTSVSLRKVSAVSLLAPLVLFSPTLTGLWDTAVSTFRFSASGSFTRIVTEERFFIALPDYRFIMSSIPDDAKVLLAVQGPHLLLSSRYEVASLDLAGSTVQGAEFPFFASFETKLSWLRDSQYDFVVVTKAVSNSCLFGQASWESTFGKKNTYEDWSKYVLDWVQFADQLSTVPERLVQSAGDIVLVNLTT
jgi:hypothetical protein